MFVYCLFVVFVFCCSMENKGCIYVFGKIRCLFFLFRLFRNIEIFFCKNDSFFLLVFGLLKNDYVKLILIGF